MIDLDFFKNLNDTYGHAAGDSVLQAIVPLLESRRRTSDVLARFGGEEFCVLLTEADETGATQCRI
jgi:diguanylate cyclase (GGDEF)-like protein